MKAISIGLQTLLGVMKTKYPLKYGNCFSLETEERAYRVSNFVLENLEYLLDQKIISFPIEIEKLGSGNCLIIDERIPKDFYREDYCPICTPLNFWLPEQKKRREEEIESGILTIKGPFKFDDNTEFFIESRKFGIYQG
jgi:hypothetical protein